MAKKEITLKGIVAAINDVLRQFEEADKGRPIPSPRENMKKQLKGIRETVEGICGPDLSIPDPGESET
jgi:hypothetical protein